MLPENTNTERHWVKRVAIAAALLLFLAFLWFLFTTFFVKKVDPTVQQVEPKHAFSLDGTKLRLTGVEPEVVDLGPMVSELIKKQPAVQSITNNTTVQQNTTVVQGGSGDKAAQSLELSGNILTITGGNSVMLPSSPADGDGVIGNEITDTVTGGGLLRVGSGTVLDPYKVGLQNCVNNEILKSNGTSWNCAADAGGAYTAGTGISIVGTTISNTGVLTVGGSGPVTSTGGQNPTLTFANGASNGQIWQWNGSAWVLASLAAETDGVVGNEVTNITGGNSGLIRSGTGTSIDPYTLALSVGNGLQLAAGSVVINSPTCAGTTKLQWDGTAFVCAADQDTTYSAGTGLSLVGTTFNNTGVLGVTGSGAITSTGGQNPAVAFADGTVSGQYWSWNGSAWVLATPAVNNDNVIGNEVTNVTGGNSGLVRSGTGTSVDPYTLAASVGNGLQLIGGAIAINSPTCAGTTKLQWDGTAFVCAADQDTTYTAGTGLSLVGTTFSLASCIVSGSYACQGGNTLGTALNLGTKDANAFNFLINNATAATLTAGGSLNIVNGALTIGGTTTTGFTTPQAISVGTKINIPIFDPGNFGQIVALGLPSSASLTARVLSLFDNRAAAHQPTLAVFAPNENNSAGLSWEGSNAIAYLKNTNGGIAIRNNTTDNAYFSAGGDVGIGNGSNAPTARLQVSGPSGIIFAVTDTTATSSTVMTIQDEGLAVFQNRTDMTSAFRVASANGSIMFNIDTVNFAVKIGGGDVGATNTPATLVLDHKNGINDPTGINGAMYYNEAYNSLRCYENGTWKSCLAPIDTEIAINTATSTTWNAMPASLTELFGAASQRTALDTTGGAIQARLLANVVTAGSAGAELRLQYSVNDGGAWTYVDGVSGPGMSIASTGLKISSWVNMDTNSRLNENTWFRVVGIGGDGVANPVIGSVKVQLR